MKRLTAAGALGALLTFSLAQAASHDATLQATIAAAQLKLGVMLKALDEYLRKAA